MSEELEVIGIWDILSEKESDWLYNYIIDNEDKVKGMGEGKYDGTVDDAITGRFMIHNYMYGPCGDLLIPKLYPIFKELKLQYPISIQCWANIFREGEGIEEHMHGGGFISGHIFLGGDKDVGTWYQPMIKIIHDYDWNDSPFKPYVEQSVKLNPDDRPKQFVKTINEKGALVLFPSEMYHHAPPNTSKKKRVTLALNIEPKERQYEFEVGYEIKGKDLSKPLWELNEKKSFYIIEDDNEMEKRKSLEG